MLLFQNIFLDTHSATAHPKHIAKHYIRSDLNRMCYLAATRRGREGTGEGVGKAEREGAEEGVGKGEGKGAGATE